MPFKVAAKCGLSSHEPLVSPAATVRDGHLDRAPELEKQPCFGLIRILRFEVAPLEARSSVASMNTRYTGKCLCGGVSYVVEGPSIVVAQCHCQECSRLSGTGHTVGAMFRADDVSVTGRVSEFKYFSDKGSEVTKAFCAVCGSPVYGTNTRTPDFITMTLGSMDDASSLEVEVVIFERDKPHWDRLGRDVVSFATQPDWEPDG